MPFAPVGSEQVVFVATRVPSQHVIGGAGGLVVGPELGAQSDRWATRIPSGHRGPSAVVPPNPSPAHTSSPTTNSATTIPAPITTGTRALRAPVAGRAGTPGLGAGGGTVPGRCAV